jgi:hypothetical protein
MRLAAKYALDMNYCRQYLFKNIEDIVIAGTFDNLLFGKES